MVVKQKGGKIMYFHQADVFRGMSRDFLKEFMAITVKESHEKGHLLFCEGERASHFYILLKGHVRISLGETGQAVSTVDQPGEAFGWSSIVGRDVYSASAECKEPTRLLKVEAERLQSLLEKNPANGLIFFKRIAGILGNRLIQIYSMISAASQPEISLSFGTGQVSESEATTS
jgi:CRP-like cAMP-binding protein